MKNNGVRSTFESLVKFDADDGAAAGCLLFATLMFVVTITVAHGEIIGGIAFLLSTLFTWTIFVMSEGVRHRGIRSIRLALVALAMYGVWMVSFPSSFSSSAGKFDIPLLVIAAIVLLVGEAIYWVDKKRPCKGESRMWFTAERKCIALCKGALLAFGGYGACSLSVKAYHAAQENYGVFAQVITWVLIGIAVIAIAYGYIWLNSLKYRSKEKPKTRRAR